MRFNSVAAETFASLVVGVAIIGTVSVGLAKMLEYHSGIERDYARNQELRILRDNSLNVVRKIDTSSVAEREVFTLKKDSNAHRFLILTGSSMTEGEYVDRYGNPLADTGTYRGDAYSRRFSYALTGSGFFARKTFAVDISELVR